MAGTVLVREVLRRVSGLLQDDSPQFTRFLEASLIDYLNDAQVAVAKYLPPACSRLDAIKLRPGPLQSIESIAALDCKPGDGSTPAVPILGNQLLDVTENMGANGTTAGRAIRVVDSKMLDAVDQAWRTRTAETIVRNYAHDPARPRYFVVTPPVHATTAVWVRAHYTAQPLKIPPPGGGVSYAGAGTGAGVTETIKIADEYVDELVNYTVARAHMADNEWTNPAKAAAFANLFIASLSGKALILTGQNPNLKRLPFAPEPVGAAA